jgi:hypothetical protein
MPEAAQRDLRAATRPTGKKNGGPKPAVNLLVNEAGSFA